MSDLNKPEEVSGDGGFTFLEALVALVLLALIFSFVSPLISSGFRVWEASRQIDQNAQILAAKSLIRELLMNVQPTRIRDTQGKLILAFAGHAQYLKFSTVLPEGHLKAGIYDVLLYLQPSCTPVYLSCLEISLQPEDRKDVSVSQFLFFTSEFSIRYFGRPTGHQHMDWHSTWQEADRLPALIQITAFRAEVNVVRFTAEIKLAPLSK